MNALSSETNRRQRILRLRAAAPAILPSLLLCDFGNLAAEVRRLEQAGAPGLHLDVMDGVFVDNLTYGFPIVAAVRKLTQLPIDVHLMIQEPERYLRRFHEAGADGLTIHLESTPQPAAALRQIRELGCAAGLALNPATPMDRVFGCLSECDLVLPMSVQAGFGGQSFQSVALERLKEIRQAGGPDLLLQVDGGINMNTIGRCAAAGAQLFVVGSGIFNGKEPAENLHELTAAARDSVSLLAR